MPRAVQFRSLLASGKPPPGNGGGRGGADFLTWAAERCSWWPAPDPDRRVATHSPELRLRQTWRSAEGANWGAEWPVNEHCWALGVRGPERSGALGLVTYADSGSVVVIVRRVS